MTATDELRRMLDERGIEWGNIRDDGSESHYLTEWEFGGIQSYAVAIEWSVGGGLSVETHRHGLTPAQAIAATIGRGTCRIEERHGDLYCTGCGEMVGTSDPTDELCIDGNAIELWGYCPRCGREVIEL